MMNSVQMSKQSDTGVFIRMTKLYMNSMNKAQKQMSNVCVLGGIFTNAYYIHTDGQDKTHGGVKKSMFARSPEVRGYTGLKQVVEAPKRKMDSLVIHPVMKAFLAGSVSGTCSTILFQPLDLIKTRLQQTTTPFKQGMFATAREVMATDRTRGLWRGLVPSVTRTVPGVGIYFSSMHWLKSKLCSGTSSPVASVGVGMLGRSIAGVTMIPVTVVKTRFESASFGYRSVSSALMMIYRTEGVRGLSAGLVPTLVRDAPFSGIYLLFYDQLKPLVPSLLLEASPDLAYFVCGLGAGAAASTITHPADVVKTKMQICESKGSLAATVKMIYRTHGSAGFWRGLTPRLVRRTLMAALAWTVYENVMRNVGLK